MSSKRRDKSKELPPHKRKQCEPTRDIKPKSIRICSELVPEVKPEVKSNNIKDYLNITKLFGWKKDEKSELKTGRCGEPLEKSPGTVQGTSSATVKLPEFNLAQMTKNISLDSTLSNLQSSIPTLGRSQKQMLLKWAPSASFYFAAGALAVIYFCEWKTVLQYLPLYNTKYADDEDDDK